MPIIAKFGWTTPAMPRRANNGNCWHGITTSSNPGGGVGVGADVWADGGCDGGFTGCKGALLGTIGITITKVESNLRCGMFNKVDGVRIKRDPLYIREA
jgi:hypothetical protein